jgi:nitrate reductase NapA
MKLTRREFIRSTAVTVAAAAAGIAEAQVSNVITDPGSAGLKWHKAPCRFCGTGCGVTVAVKANKVVATLGDPLAEVNGCRSRCCA